MTPPAAFIWTWHDQSVAITWNEVGASLRSLVYRSFVSTISTREQLRLMAERLAVHGFRCTLLDWPGSEKSDRLPLDYEPALVRSFSVVTCGHVTADPVSQFLMRHLRWPEQA